MVLSRSTSLGEELGGQEKFLRWILGISSYGTLGRVVSWQVCERLPHSDVHSWHGPGGHRQWPRGTQALLEKFSMLIAVTRQKAVDALKKSLQALTLVLWDLSVPPSLSMKQCASDWLTRLLVRWRGVMIECGFTTLCAMIFESMNPLDPCGAYPSWYSSSQALCSRCET